MALCYTNSLHFIRLTLLMPYVYAMAGFHLPSHCVCGKVFTISHALSWPLALVHSAFPIIYPTKLMSEVCHDVQVEHTHLHPLSGELLCYKSAVHEDDARVDIRASAWLLRLPASLLFF